MVDYTEQIDQVVSVGWNTIALTIKITQLDIDGFAFWYRIESDPFEVRDAAYWNARFKGSTSETIADLRLIPTDEAYVIHSGAPPVCGLGLPTYSDWPGWYDVSGNKLECADRPFLGLGVRFTTPGDLFWGGHISLPEYDGASNRIADPPYPGWIDGETVTRLAEA